MEQELSKQHGSLGVPAQTHTFEMADGQTARALEGSNRLKKKLKFHILKRDKQKKLDQICWYGLLTDEVEVWARGNQMPPRLPVKQKNYISFTAWSIFVSI